jgi:hypothetical protein
MAHRQRGPQEVVMSALSHRPRSTVLSAIVAGLMMLALPAAAGARPDTHGVPAAPVNAPGTDVAAPDQQAPRTVIRLHPSSLAATAQVDRVEPISPVDPAPSVSPVDAADDSGPTITLLALIALGLGFAAIGYASWLAVSRKRSRATV